MGEVEAGDGSLEADTQVVYLAIGLRNAGSGIAVLHGWHFYPEWYRDREHAPLEDFERQNRDLYVPVRDIGFWQGAFRDPAHRWYEGGRKVIDAREAWTVELLYGDHEGGQRTITRFTVLPVNHPARAADADTDPDPDPGLDAQNAWLATASRH